MYIVQEMLRYHKGQSFLPLLKVFLNHKQEKYTNRSPLIQRVLVFPMPSSQVERRMPKEKLLCAKEALEPPIPKCHPTRLVLVEVLEMEIGGTSGFAHRVLSFEMSLQTLQAVFRRAGNGNFNRMLAWPVRSLAASGCLHLNSVCCSVLACYLYWSQRFALMDKLLCRLVSNVKKEKERKKA